MNEHILITPSGMDCQCTTVLLSTNLMLLSTVRRERAFIYCREFNKLIILVFDPLFPSQRGQAIKERNCDARLVVERSQLFCFKKNLSFIIYIKHSLCSQKPKLSMHLSLYMFYYIYTECSVHFLNSFQVCKWYLREGYSYRNIKKKRNKTKKKHEV